MVSVLISLLVIVAAINLLRFFLKPEAATPALRNPALDYERELKRLERRKKLALVFIGGVALLLFLAGIFLDWL